MQQGYAESLLRSGIIEAKAGAKGTARRYLERAIYTSDNQSHEVMAEAWFWLAEISDNPVEKRQALENAISHDLGHARARRALAVLDGKIKPGEIVNPDALPPAPEHIVQAEAERFMCPKCGGRMRFAPDGQSLVCEYCTRHERLEPDVSAPAEEDFLVAMSTLRGHRRPLAQQVFHCKGCGAEFTLPPTLISANCLYCGSPYVVSLEKSRELIAPDAILPHAFDQKRAARYLVQWVEKQDIQPESKVALPGGLYLPVWIFDLGGEIRYTAQLLQQENPFSEELSSSPHVENSYPIRIGNLAIPASRKLAQLLALLLPSFELAELRPYDQRYLADWPAEVYDVPVGDASLDARSQAFNRLKRELPALVNGLHILSTSSAGMTVESFKLALVPAWMTTVRHQGRDEAVLINGRSGAAASNALERKGLLDWLADLFDE
jgi:hypothetical protein